MSILFIECIPDFEWSPSILKVIASSTADTARYSAIACNNCTMLWIYNLIQAKQSFPWIMKNKKPWKLSLPPRSSPHTPLSDIWTSVKQTCIKPLASSTSSATYYKHEHLYKNLHWLLLSCCCYYYYASPYITISCFFI